MLKNTISQQRAAAALKSLFVADALAMPVHWYYNPIDIFHAFPDGITGFEAAPEHHPSSIMSLHSTSKGGRKSAAGNTAQRELVGDVILKGRRKHWGVSNKHYHHGMPAGENTLNAHCTRALIRTLAANNGHYDRDKFLDVYIELMTADPPQHPDTYAESYHRGFFANLELGKAPHECGEITHDTASIGGLVTIAPILFSERLSGTALDEVKEICVNHLMLTHPDQYLAKVCKDYVGLLDELLFLGDSSEAQKVISAWSKRSIGLQISEIFSKIYSDHDFVGRMFSSACYITDSWPSVLYLAYKYVHDQQAGLLANTNLGGDNVHRGAVLGVLLGLANNSTLTDLFEKLVHHQEIEAEISSLLTASDHQ